MPRPRKAITEGTMPPNRNPQTPKPNVLPPSRHVPKPATAPVPTSPPVHPQWEYHTARSRDGVTWTSSFDELGRYGWELVSIFATWDALTAPSYHAVFKRRAGG